MPRNLSNHVCSRWYRPPEIILIDKYDFKVDMWSLGCIFAEIIIKIYKPKNLPENTTQMFNGLSCYPLSPTKHTRESDKRLNINSQDQLCMILQKLQVIKESDTSFITDDNALVYLNKIEKR